MRVRVLPGFPSLRGKQFSHNLASSPPEEILHLNISFTFWSSVSYIPMDIKPELLWRERDAVRQSPKPEQLTHCSRSQEKRLFVFALACLLDWWLSMNVCRSILNTDNRVLNNQTKNQWRPQLSIIYRERIFFSLQHAGRCSKMHPLFLPNDITQKLHSKWTISQSL